MRLLRCRAILITLKIFVKDLRRIILSEEDAGLSFTKFLIKIPSTETNERSDERLGASPTPPTKLNKSIYLCQDKHNLL